MNKLFDLSFVIGIFFTIVGLLLLFYGFSAGEEAARTINKWCGLAFTIFGIFMILISFKKDDGTSYAEEENVDTPLSQYGENESI
ncbi:MAG: hypothetical protein H0V30_02325 [Chitinophagaceae bacterium]|jgi:putative Mn2+ efflux pump MntP|nr:hypothetical protein [Chitinophagaceae bacterium]